MNQSSRPVYLRLRELIAAAIIEGRYREGEMLPSVRAFASEQGANPLTVAKAYQQFQVDGLVEVQRGVGMYVVPGAAEKLRQAERRHFIEQEWPEIHTRLQRLGIEAAELLDDASSAGPSPRLVGKLSEPVGAS
jgi:GntR family transcriptional regulator